MKFCCYRISRLWRTEMPFWVVTMKSGYFWPWKIAAAKLTNLVTLMRKAATLCCHNCCQCIAFQCNRVVCYQCDSQECLVVFKLGHSERKSDKTIIEAGTHQCDSQEKQIWNLVALMGGRTKLFQPRGNKPTEECPPAGNSRQRQQTMPMVMIMTTTKTRNREHF